MTGNLKPFNFQENMGSDHSLISSNYEPGELFQKGGQKFPVSEDANGLQHSSTKSDSFVVDMERFSHLIEKDISSNSRIGRTPSRQGWMRGVDNNINSATPDLKDLSTLPTSPTATLHGGSTPQKASAVGAVGATNHHVPQVHHQITIKNGSMSSIAAEGQRGGKRLSFRRSTLTSLFHPTRILFICATISSIGSIILIYVTLTIGNLNEGGDNVLDHF
ncbi:uncharacterized protein LOC105167966 isoform X2 [Sesamum indicum]|uniref:Uncharacterized protein LOC105167966 isoform X2 n=1 Tax=Sesamum indicum TaxID=4182 RepID=A0A6I9TK46_SESIN|nr:uncharacterized protein LOC105167966 isoform X2 [Sesamum indicum]